MRSRGVRGATTATANTREAICSATQELLRRLVEANEIPVEEIGSAFFTVTDDLDAEYPALAARDLGWVYVPLLCAREIPVQGGLARCIRVLLQINTEQTQEQIRHVYLREAVMLRPAFAEALESAPKSAPKSAPTARTNEGESK
jgi:chorismate mutase